MRRGAAAGVAASPSGRVHGGRTVRIQFGDSEILMFTLLVSALPYALRRSARARPWPMTSPLRAPAPPQGDAGGRVLVLGDVMLDRSVGQGGPHLAGGARPVVEIASETFHLGGAANGPATCAPRWPGRGGGIIGDAPRASRAHGLAEAGVEDALSVAGEGRPTTVKTRIIAPPAGGAGGPGGLDPVAGPGARAAATRARRLPPVAR